MTETYQPIFEDSNHQIDYEITHGKHIIELLSVANEFINFMDDCSKYDKHIIMGYLQKLLPLIYLKSSLLPEIKLDDNTADERFVTEEEYERILSILLEKFSQKCEDDHECSCTDEGPKVAEALADLYQDLKDTIILYGTNKTSAQEWAVHNCRTWFIERWGLAVADILGYIHTCIYHLHDHDEEIHTDL
ncbi:MAG: DUF5063 domain-containing protein [Bacteroidota bacterium]